MNMKRRIITFGLTEAQNALVEKGRPAGYFEVFRKNEKKKEKKKKKNKKNKIKKKNKRKKHKL